MLVHEKRYDKNLGIVSDHTVNTFIGQVKVNLSLALKGADQVNFLD